MLDLLEWALNNIERHDIRVKSGKNLVHELKEFTEISAAFDIESNEAALKAWVQLLKRHVSMLEESVKQDWNVKLGKENEPTEVVTHQGDWMFFKASPLKVQKKTYSCEGEGCDKTYTNHKYYQAHLKTVHNIIKKIEPPRVTCRLDHRKPTEPIAFDQIGSHLKRVHGLTKANDGEEFRGFLSTDGGATHRPIWLRADAPDPEPPVADDNSVQTEAVGENRDMGEDGPVLVEDPQPEEETATTVIRAAELVTASDGENKDKEEAGPVPREDPQPEEKLADAPDPEPPVADDNSVQTEADGENRDMGEDGPVLREDPQPEEETATPVIRAVELATSSNGENSDKEEVGPALRVAAAQSDMEHENADVPVADFENITNAKPDFSNTLHSIEPEPNQVTFSFEVPDIVCDDSVFLKLPPEVSSKVVPVISPAEESVIEDVNHGDTFNFKEDSDIEDGDSSSFTQTRLENKKERYRKRNLIIQNDLKPHERAENKSFIEEFDRYLTKKSIKDTGTSTNDKALPHLFSAEDSLLNYMIKRNPDFKLSDLIAFKSPEFVELTDPVHGWTDTISGENGNENPSRRREQLKAHAYLREFILVKLNTFDFGTKLEDLFRRDKLKSHLQQLDTDVKNSKIWGKTKTLISQNKQKLDNAKLLVNPAQNSNEANSVSVYLSSKEFRSREARMKNIWVKFEEDEESPGPKNFNDTGNFIRHLLRKFIHTNLHI